jgi:hypothetical protein
MRIKILKKRLVWQSALLLVMDGLFFGLTDPSKVNSLFLIAGFILLGLSLYLLVQIVLSFLEKLGFKINNRRKIAVFVVILSCLLLALQSIGQLSARDVLIIIPLAILLYIYAAYVRPRTLE